MPRPFLVPDLFGFRSPHPYKYLFRREASPPKVEGMRIEPNPLLASKGLNRASHQVAQPSASVDTALEVTGGASPVAKASPLPAATSQVKLQEESIRLRDLLAEFVHGLRAAQASADSKQQAEGPK